MEGVAIGRYFEAIMITFCVRYFEAVMTTVCVRYFGGCSL